MNTFSLEEKSVIITGGLGGYGLAITKLILKRGGRVLLADLKPQAEGQQVIDSQFKEECEAGKLLYTQCNVTQESDWNSVFEVAHKELTLPDQSVDILINAAGIVGEQNWQRLYQVNIVSSN